LRGSRRRCCIYIRRIWGVILRTRQEPPVRGRWIFMMQIGIRRITQIMMSVGRCRGWSRIVMGWIAVRVPGGRTGILRVPVSTRRLMWRWYRILPSRNRGDYHLAVGRIAVGTGRRGRLVDRRGGRRRRLRQRSALGYGWRRRRWRLLLLGVPVRNAY
jgi:hypothetical protein